MPSEQNLPPTPAEHVWRLMQSFVDANSRKHELAEVLGFGLGAGRGKVLLRLRGGPMTLSDLARSQGVDAPYATVIVDKLEGLGLVERRAHPDDHRRKLVALTPAGRDAVAMARTMLATPPQDLASLTRNDLKEFEVLLQRLGATYDAD
jgi:DNA-binding MarR family transcriptional regulator